MTTKFHYGQEPGKPGTTLYIEERCRRGCCIERQYIATYRELAGNGSYICTTGVGFDQREILVGPYDVKKATTPQHGSPERTAPRQYRTRASGSKMA